MRSALHPHQHIALDRLRAALLAGHRRPMIQAPTGAGKTMLAAAIADGALAKGKRVLFVVPFLSLVDQTVTAFAAEGIASVGVMQGQHPMTDAAQPLQVASLQTLRRRRLPAADIVIIDEAHRWFDFLGTWMGMPDWQNVQRDRGYKPGYAAAKFRTRYGTWPRNLEDAAEAPDGPFLNWLKSQEIAFHKRRHKDASHAA